MNDFERFLHATPTEGSEAEAEVGELLRTAGPRPAMPAEEFAEIKQAAHSEWQALVRSQRGGKSGRGLGLALAATLLLALAGAFWWRPFTAGPAGTTVANVLRTEGTVRSAGAPIEPGSPLAAGAEVETRGEGSRLALRLSGGQSVRLDQATRVRLAAGDRLELEQGAIYFDSADSAGNGIEIATAFGIVRDIGTQFEVRIDDVSGDRLQVRVREGAVVLERPGSSHSASVGEQLRLQDNGEVVVSQTPLYGEDWAWAQAVAPTFDVDGQSLSRYLEWVQRETGWTVEFEDPALGASAPTVVVSGTIESLTARESLSVILPASGMSHRVEDGALIISSARGD